MLSKIFFSRPWGMCDVFELERINPIPYFHLLPKNPNCLLNLTYFYQRKLQCFVVRVTTLLPDWLNISTVWGFLHTRETMCRWLRTSGVLDPPTHKSFQQAKVTHYRVFVKLKLIEPDSVCCLILIKFICFSSQFEMK